MLLGCRMEFTITFIKLFMLIMYLGAPILFFLCSVIVILGLVVGKREGWTIFDSIYWTFITAFTVGYGDIRPKGKLSKVLAVTIAWIGISFTGVLVAATVASTTAAIKKHIEPTKLEEAKLDLN